MNIDAKEAARLIRAEFAATFPGVEFSVRLNPRKDYHDYATVLWVDGPPEERVYALTRAFDYQRQPATWHGEPINFTGFGAPYCKRIP